MRALAASQCALGAQLLAERRWKDGLLHFKGALTLALELTSHPGKYAPSVHRGPDGSNGGGGGGGGGERGGGEGGGGARAERDGWEDEREGWVVWRAHVGMAECYTGLANEVIP